MTDRLMTNKTRVILELQKLETEQKLREMGRQSDGGDARAGFHDDAGFENAKNRTLGDLLRIGNLSEVVIIEPRTDTSNVGIGNKVQVKFVEEGETETIYVLGEDDVIRRTDLVGTVVSALSPLGKAIFGRTKNETVEVKIGDTDKIRVEILKIEKGDF